jgi:hypothetical protein
MAQRKPKEPLLAEVPRPRLSDEELMELFYSGQRKATDQQKEQDNSSRTEAIAPELSDRNILEQGEENKLSLEKGTLREGYLQEPSQSDKPQAQFLRSAGDEQFGDKTQHLLLTKLDQLSDKGNTPSVEQSEQKSSVSVKGYPEKPSLQESSPEKPIYKESFKREALLPSDRYRTATAPKETVPDIFRAAFEILPTLGPLEQLFYLWFLNLSHTVGQTSCRVTMALLQRATGVSEKLVRETLRSLLGRGYLRLLDGGAAGRATLYHVAHPKEISESAIEGSPREPSLTEPFLEEDSPGKVPYGKVPRHIERESNIYTLSQREPFSREGSPQKGSKEVGSSYDASAESTVPPALMDSVLDRFYSMTGQLRISRQKRERSRTQLLDLLRQGFRVDDVLYTIDWAREHITSPIHSFGIIPEIIGQALGRREGARHERPHPHSQLPSQSPATSEQEHDNQRLADIQASLTPDDQASIQREAEKLVEQEYGPHVPGKNTLIRIKVAEILRKRYLDVDPSRRNET